MSTLKTLTCRKCGRTFQHEYAGNKFCSDECRKSYGRERAAEYMRAQRAQTNFKEWGLAVDPYATGALKSDAQNCPVW